jgi:hypothetical protein
MFAPAACAHLDSLRQQPVEAPSKCPSIIFTSVCRTQRALRAAAGPAALLPRHRICRRGGPCLWPAVRHRPQFSPRGEAVQKSIALCALWLWLLGFALLRGAREGRTPGCSFGPMHTVGSTGNLPRAMRTRAACCPYNADARQRQSGVPVNILLCHSRRCGPGTEGSWLGSARCKAPHCSGCAHFVHDLEPCQDPRRHWHC